MPTPKTTSPPFATLSRRALRAWMKKQTPTERMTALNELSDRELATLMFDWRFWARTKQLPPPGGWRVWLILAGRGFGKTRTGAAWVRGQHGRTACREQGGQYV